MEPFIPRNICPQSLKMRVKKLDIWKRLSVNNLKMKSTWVKAAFSATTLKMKSTWVKAVPKHGWGKA